MWSKKTILEKLNSSKKPGETSKYCFRKKRRGDNGYLEVSSLESSTASLIWGTGFDASLPQHSLPKYDSLTNRIYSFFFPFILQTLIGYRLYIRLYSKGCAYRIERQVPILIEVTFCWSKLRGVKVSRFPAPGQNDPKYTQDPGDKKLHLLVCFQSVGLGLKGGQLCSPNPVATHSPPQTSSDHEDPV